MTEPFFLLSPVPPVCQCCGLSFEIIEAHRVGQNPNPPKSVMFDANILVPTRDSFGRPRTTRMWGNWCLFCFIRGGGKLGTGFGQRYELQTTGKYAGRWLQRTHI